MITQKIFYLSAKRRGCHLITREILENLPQPLPKTGLLNLFVQHTSCALTINENADPDVRSDMEEIMNHLVKEREPYYVHTIEGPDDMPAHAKCSLFGASVNGNQKCSDFGNSECSIFGIKTTVLLASAVQ